VFATVLGLGAYSHTDGRPSGGALPDAVSRAAYQEDRLALTPADLTEVVQRYCVRCHSDRRLAGNLTLEAFAVELSPELAQTAEKMILKLRAGMMPPPGASRPPVETLHVLARTMETMIDDGAARAPNPGTRSFQRLNRAEYEASIRDLLGLEIRAGDYLPLDTKSANFDNIADAQMLSATLLDAYLRAAAEISRLAVGDRDVAPSEVTYTKSGYYSQWQRAEGAPRGTRGGISVLHNFPADGEYVIKMAFDHTTTGGFFGDIAQGEQIEIAIDGERVMLLDVDQFMHAEDPNGVNMETEPFTATAGPHVVSAAFLQRSEGPIVDLMSPFEWSLVDRRIGSGGYGITALPHMKDMVIAGPHRVTGVSENPVRNRIFSCRPTASEEAEASCARQIIEQLGSRAYRRSLTDLEREELFFFYEEGAEWGGFEQGVRMALQAILASPAFVFRFEPVDTDGGSAVYPISDIALASRLSFFLWGGPPDDMLVELAERGELSRPAVLDAQVDRMLADPRSGALGTRFAAQWLRLDDLDRIHPDRLLFPDFYQQLADAMRSETEHFFNDLVRQDRGFLDLYTADYTFLNEPLAKHYGVSGVVGNEFRLVKWSDNRRAGILGQGSVLTLTSVANRTSPVLRGKWVLEVLLGTPAPPPPPNVPPLEEVVDADQGGRVLSTRERMELHRVNPTCNSCHQFIDPVGLALDNFDAVGRWRTRENGLPLDTRGEFYDGSAVESAEDLRRVLMERQELLVRNFTVNLMAYALGRRVEHFDMPEVRKITRAAEAEDFRMSSFIRGVVHSGAFRLTRALDAQE